MKRVTEQINKWKMHKGVCRLAFVFARVWLSLCHLLGRRYQYFLCRTKTTSTVCLDSNVGHILNLLIFFFKFLSTYAGTTGTVRLVKILWVHNIFMLVRIISNYDSCSKNFVRQIFSFWNLQRGLLLFHHKVRIATSMCTHCSILNIFWELQSRRINCKGRLN